jgi:TonB-dependent starch-binding outer membrane protein SusC
MLYYLYKPKAMRKLLLLFLVFCGLQLSAMAQQKIITGTVTGLDDGQPVIGCTVLVQGTTVGTTTDVDGKYQINASEGSTLEFRFVGMKTRTVLVGQSDIIDMQLEYDILGMDEVIVVAYGTQRREAKTGSVSVVDNERIRDIPEASLDKMLGGKIAGVVISSSSGQPGGNTDVRIRGTSTILAGSQPLYVIDGVPVMDPVTEGDDSYLLTNTSNTLSSINPNDIESISVLKDAAAASIYGSRAANGVILITTRSGKEGRSTVNFRTSTGLDILANDNGYNAMTAGEYLQYARDAVKNAGLDPDDPAGGNYYYPESLMDSTITDWYKELTRTGKIYNAEISLEGGNEKIKHYFSGAYESNEGVFYGVKFEKYQVRSNVDYKINDKLNLGTRITGVHSTTNDVPMQYMAFANPLFGSLLISPFTRIKNDDGTYNLIIPENSNTNPRATAEYDDNLEKQNRFNGNLSLEWKVLKNLTLKTTNNYEIASGEGRRYWDPMSNYGFDEGYLQSGRTEYSQTTTSNTLNYRQMFSSHSLQAIAGQEATRYSANLYYVTSPDVDPAIPYLNTGTSANDDADYDEEGYTLLSYFGVLYYNYGGKYFLQGSIRTDGSSRFGKENRWGTFWSVGASWNMHNENFIKDLGFINLLKIRASYGLSGNFNIGYYEHYGLYGTVQYNGYAGAAPEQPSNPELGWENNKELNAGFDYALFDRFTGSFEVYSRTTTDMLLNYPLSRTSGFTSIRQNIGELRNRGFEFLIDASILRGGDLNLNAGFNISHNNSEILDLGKDEQFLNPDNSRIVHKVGEHLYSYYLYDFAGVNPANGDALWWTEDGELSNEFSDARRIIAGSPEPVLTGGFSTNISWKGIALDLNLEYKYGNKVLIEEMHYSNSDGFSWLNNQANTGNDYWKEPGDIARNPKPIADNPTLSSSYRNTRWMFDGSYLRVKNITLSYNLPADILDRIDMQNLRIYGSAVNLYTFHNVDYYDPERGAQGAGYGIYPQTKKFVVGLEVSF